MKTVEMSRRQTLFDIALREYGDASKAWDIASENNMAITEWKEFIALPGIPEDNPIVNQSVDSATGVAEETSSCQPNQWVKPDDFPDIVELIENSPLTSQYANAFIVLYPNNFIDFELKAITNNRDGLFVTSDGYIGSSYVHQWDASKDIPITSRAAYNGVRWVMCFVDRCNEITTSKLANNLYCIWLYLHKGSYGGTTSVTAEDYMNGNFLVECIDSNINVNIYTICAHACMSIRRIGENILNKMSTYYLNGFNYSSFNARIENPKMTADVNILRYSDFWAEKFETPTTTKILRYSFISSNRYAHEINTNNVTDIHHCFNSMPLVPSIIMPSVTKFALWSNNSTFSGFRNLQKLDFGGRYNDMTFTTSAAVIICNFSNSLMLARESVVALSNVLIDRSGLSSQTIVFPLIVWNRLSEEEKMILPNKNYTINLI